MLRCVIVAWRWPPCPRLRPARARRAASARLAAIAATASDGLMLPEQVWDENPPSGRPGFAPGTGTLSATPLAWTHAQFVRLAWSIDAGHPVAVWEKVLRGELEDDLAATLDAALIADVRNGRFAVVPVADTVIARSLTCVRQHGLRAADAVQLASALLTREADPGADTMAVFDQRLRVAASAEGLALLPAP